MSKIIMTWGPVFMTGEAPEEIYHAVKAVEFRNTVEGEGIKPTRTLEEILLEKHPEAQIFYIQEIRPIDQNIKVIRYVVE